MIIKEFFRFEDYVGLKAWIVDGGMQFRDIRRNPRRNFNNIVYSKIFLIWKIIPK